MSQRVRATLLISTGPSPGAMPGRASADTATTGVRRAPSPHRAQDHTGPATGPAPGRGRRTARLNICYYHQDLHLRRLHPGPRPRLQGSPQRPSYSSRRSVARVWAGPSSGEESPACSRLRPTDRQRRPGMGPTLQRHPFSGLGRVPAARGDITGTHPPGCPGDVTEAGFAGGCVKGGRTEPRPRCTGPGRPAGFPHSPGPATPVTPFPDL